MTYDPGSDWPDRDQKLWAHISQLIDELNKCVRAVVDATLDAADIYDPTERERIKDDLRQRGLMAFRELDE